MNRSTLIASAVSLIGLTSVFSSTSAQAAIVNGSFETNDFTGWTTIGDASTKTSAYGSTPTAGTYQALLLATPQANTAVPADLESFLGLTTGSLDNGQTSQGSAIEQTFTGLAGQVLTFNWNFLTSDATPANPNFNDFSFVTIGSLSKLADTTSTFVASKTSFSKETGYKTFSYTIPTTGSYTLGIGVANLGDTFGNAGILVDNVTLASTPVPEPNAAWGILAFGVFGFGSMLKRQHH